MRILMARALAPLLGLLLAALPLARAPAQDAASTDGFTAAQREAIVHILRDALTRDPSILREAATALQADDARREQQSARSAIAAARPQLMADPADPVAGNAQGDVTIVEFYDTRCPYCRRLEPVMDEVLRADPGVRLVYKDLPILGASSMLGARALLAAQRQDGYLKLRAALMRPGPEATRDSIGADATAAGLDPARLARDMDDPQVQSRIQANLRLAQTLGIQGTPAMVIGGTLIPGAVTLAELQSAIGAARGKP